jgi:hypothetical protein
MLAVSSLMIRISVVCLLTTPVWLYRIDLSEDLNKKTFKEGFSNG